MTFERNIDLRSDLVSKPTPEMVKEIALAANCDQGFHYRENLHVRKLEQLAADILDLEDALFCPSCTMCNQIAINATVRQGEVVLAMADAHVVVSEAGAPAVLSGAMIQELPEPFNGKTRAQTIEHYLIRARDFGSPKIGLVILENTHTRSGGRVLSVMETEEIVTLCHRYGVPVHIDGARLFNAAVALSAPVKDLASSADMVSISLNKGLCAPVGALIAGSKDMISRASQIRQRFGGGWRPAGILAAAGIVALEQMPKELHRDHEKAKKLATELKSIDGVHIENDPVQTNIVSVAFEDPDIDVHHAVEMLECEGVLALAFPSSSIRFVIHRDIAESDLTVVRMAVMNVVKLYNYNK